MQVFDGVGVENVLRAGCLGPLLGLGELADGGGRGEAPLENSWRTRGQLAPQHRGRHRRECVWSEGGKVRFGVATRVQSGLGCFPSNFASHRMKCVTATTLALFVLAAFAREEKPCTVHDEGGTYYDLNGLSAK